MKSRRIRHIRDLKYDDFARVIVSYDNEWSNSAKDRIKLAFNACSGLEDESDKKYRLWQTIQVLLWEFPEAVDIGFNHYAKKNFIERYNALQYHDKNCKGKDCKVCDIMDRWENER